MPLHHPTMLMVRIAPTNVRKRGAHLRRVTPACTCVALLSAVRRYRLGARAAARAARLRAPCI
jgi:hypothetical protein